VKACSRIGFGVLGAFLVSTGGAVAQDLTSDPNGIRLEVGDARRLAQVLRSVADSERAAAVERDYLGKASPGLRRYATEYKVSGASIAAALTGRPDGYAGLDRTADAVLAQEPALRSAFRKLKDLFPGAMFPPVWFVAGHFSAGGMVEREGVIIALERFIDNPDGIVPIVMHELAHFQSAMVLGPEVYLRAIGPDGTLLSRALREGSAELFAELTAGRHINPVAERYGLQHERELWTRFQQDMTRPEPGDWMFVRPANGEWPQDLGYWMGYRIARSYYDRAEDKPKAVRDILNLTDFAAFLKASGYPERFN
jgi:hypothetical protein